jgi:hypothetical protein
MVHRISSSRPELDSSNASLNHPANSAAAMPPTVLASGVLRAHGRKVREEVACESRGIDVQTLQIKHGSLGIRFALARPRFDNTARGGDLFERLFGVLSRYGLSLGDVVTSPPGGRLADDRIECALYDRGVIVTVAVDAISVDANLSRVNHKHHQPVVIDTFRVVEAVLGSRDGAIYEAQMCLEGPLVPGPWTDVVDAYIARKPCHALGTPQRRSVGFEYDGPDGTTSIDLASSSKVAEGLSLTTRFTFPASSMSAAALPDRFIARFKGALEALELAVEDTFTGTRSLTPPDLVLAPL